MDSVMAFGYQSYLTVMQRFVSPEEKKKAGFYSRIALRSRGNVSKSPNTLLKLYASQLPNLVNCSILIIQTILAMVGPTGLTAYSLTNSAF